MDLVFYDLIPIALIVVAVILIAGLLNMMRGGSASRSQGLMRARVIAQFVAIVIVMVAVYLIKK